MTSVQASLFDTSPDPWDLDAAADRFVATVVITTGPDRVYDYLVPDKLRGAIGVGRRLRVPFGQGNKLTVGYCVRLEQKPGGQRRLKEVQSLVDERPLLSLAMVRLTEWMSEHYLAPWGQVIEAVLPAGVRAHAGTRETQFLSVPPDIAARLRELKLPPRQAEVLAHLAAAPKSLTLRELCAATQVTTAPIQALRKKGLIVAENRRVAQAARGASATEPVSEREAHLKMEPDQSAALHTILGAIAAGEHRTVLIHGVTGSGKTEVYIQAIQEVLSHGRQAIVLVPEISLTPQTEQRFRSRFGDVAVLHSNMSDADRHRYWRKIAAGQSRVIVGARSAVFAPTERLGLIVLDEEHESTFKQSEAPRYHARDVALFRARAEGAPLVLGSATPSLESWRRAALGEYQLVSLPKRIFNRPMPDVATIDLRLEFKDRKRRGAISRPLQLAMNTALADNGQVILLLNRRGYSTHIQCQACGHALRCPHCTIALTHHITSELAVCHYCDFEMPAPTTCPECNFIGIHYGGLGTQKLEAEVRARFPDHRCLRMDTDTMDKPGSHERALAAFRAGEAQILLGTQMIAKGLDFPNVTLVGVVNADTALHLADFRAAERTFQLVTQVAGRTGRGPRGGRVLVQTFSPEHPAIMAAVRHDYQRFADNELPARESLGYAPFQSMIRVIVRSPIETQVEAFAEQVGDSLRSAIAARNLEARVLGPAPAPISKLRGKYRYHLQLHAADEAGLRGVMRSVMDQLKAPDETQWVVDVDPLEML
jgi:primosomal protein N' (replication factor Y)